MAGRNVVLLMLSLVLLADIYQNAEYKMPIVKLLFFCEFSLERM